ncbi:MAG: hypothetical protein HY650_08355 [Acidobacteria bacterium]|nr:hypothetical protein [Acidobacteriota bacterium]
MSDPFPPPAIARNEHSDMYCGHCGAIVTVDQRFCRLCGANLLTPGSAAAPHPGISADSSNRFLMGIEVLVDALTRGVRYFFRSETAEIDRANSRGRYARWGYLLFWAGIAAGFLGRSGGLAVFVIGIILMVYARLGKQPGAAFQPHEPPTLRTPDVASPSSWATGGLESRGERAVRQPPYPGQFAETTTVKLPTERTPPGEAK